MRDERRVPDDDDDDDDDHESFVRESLFLACAAVRAAGTRVLDSQKAELFNIIPYFTHDTRTRRERELILHYQNKCGKFSKKQTFI